MKSSKISKQLRLLVLTAILVFVTYESYLHQVLGGGKAPSVHALCPFGALESLYNLIFLGSYIQKIYSGTAVLLIITLVLAIVFRRSFCGLLCPFGALQELFARLGQKIFPRRITVPQKLDVPLRYLKYIVLVLTILMAWLYGSLWMAPYDPYSAYAHITAVAADIAEDPLVIIGYILLLVTILGSFIYDRFFCKYLCPMGAFYGIVGKFSPTKVERDADLCIGCNLCSKACPVNIDVAKSGKVTSMECISCNECVSVCPKKGALQVKTAGKAISPLAMLVIIAALFFGTVWIAQATGNFEVLPEALKQGETIPLSEVKGYFTIEETAKAIGVELEDAYKLLGIPQAVPPSTKMKEIHGIVPEFDFDAVKEKAEDGEKEVYAAQEKIVSNNVDGKLDLSELRGSMTIRQAADTLKIDLKDFYKLFKIPEDVPAQTTMKDIQNVSPGYDYHKVKTELEE